MSARNDGGPAFPPGLIDPATSEEALLAANKGLSLRDYFAAKALPVAMDMMRLDFDRDLGDEWRWNRPEVIQCAEHAYELADAMLRARGAA